VIGQSVRVGRRDDDGQPLETLDTVSTNDGGALDDRRARGALTGRSRRVRVLWIVIGIIAVSALGALVGAVGREHPKQGPAAQALVTANGHLERATNVIGVQYIGVGEYCVKLAHTIVTSTVVPIITVIPRLGAHADAVWVPDAKSWCPNGIAVATRIYDALPGAGNRSDEGFAIVIP
jgi:hypothetical protein